MANPFKKSVCGVGYLGSIDNEGVSFRHCKIASLWRNMIHRCYGDIKSKRDYVYDNCEVIEEWHNFQNFKKWCLENYYEVDGEKMNLDKDILIKGSELYSPETCVFVPRFINTLFIKSNRIRGKYPLGVHLNSKQNKLKAQCKTRNKVVHLGYYDNEEDAFYAYKNFKESYIKEVAEEYRYKIPEKLYLAMLNYKVEITD